MSNKSQPELFHELIILYCDLYFFDQSYIHVGRKAAEDHKPVQNANSQYSVPIPLKFRLSLLYFMSYNCDLVSLN